MRADLELCPLCVAGLREAPLPFLGGLDERDVSHVRDRRLDDAREPDPDEPALGPRRIPFGDPLLVPREGERVVEAARVVAGVVQPSRRRPVRKRVGRDQVAPRERDLVEAEPTRGDRHHALEWEVELRAAEATVQPRRAAVCQHDAVPDGHVLHAVGAGERAVHPVQGRRLGGTDVGADVLDRVPAKRQQLAVGGEGRLEIGHPRGRRRAGREMLEPVLDPSDRHAELPRREAEQDDVRVDGRLDAVAATRVRRRDQPQPRTGQPEGGRGDRVEGERALEVRPGRERSGRRVPLRDHAVALDRGGAPAREREALPHDQVSIGERRGRLAVGERAIRGDEPGRRGGRQRVEHRLERLVVDLDQLERVLGDVAVARDHDRDRLPGIAGGLDRCGVVGDRTLYPGRERAGERRDVGAGQDPDDSGVRERRRDIDARDPCMSEGRPEDRGVRRIRDGVEIVDEPAASPEEHVVLEPGERLPDPGRARCRAHAAEPTSSPARHERRAGARLPRGRVSTGGTGVRFAP